MSPEELIGDRIEQALGQAAGKPLVVGLCGAQGSGKSTMAEALAARFERSVTLSLDDLYRTRDERLALARDIHPLFATRGVPGTHDVALGVQVIDGLRAGEVVALPHFNKAVDDRVPRYLWKAAPPACNLILFEGWCVGATPQDEDALGAPINALERDEDADGAWRAAVNNALAGPYQQLFARIDMLILLGAPDWETVGHWRQEQEAKLRSSARQGVGVMDAAGVARFIQHYERLSRHILTEMPRRADMVVYLNPDRSCRNVLNGGGDSRDRNAPRPAVTLSIAPNRLRSP